MPPTPLEQQLRAAGLEVLGPCERLSQCAGLLQASPLLQDFRPEEADTLGRLMLRVRAQPGQLLIGEGDPSEWLMLLLEGTVDIGKRKIGIESDGAAPGDTARLAVVRAGAVLGEMSMFDGEPRYASCWALTPVEVGVLDRPAVARLLAGEPAIAAKLLVKLTQLLAQRLRNTSAQLVRALRARPA